MGKQYIATSILAGIKHLRWEFWRSGKNNWSGRWDNIFLRGFLQLLALDRKSHLIWFQVEAEGVARRKAEARAQEAEGRAQVDAPLLFTLYLKFN